MEPFLEGTSVHYKKHNPKRIHINKRMNFTVCKITDSLICKVSNAEKKTCNSCIFLGLKLL